MAARERLPDERYLELRFEDLLERPRECIETVSRFLELPEPGGHWLDEAIGLVREAPAPRAPGLGDEERQALEAACSAGNAALGRS